MTSWLILVENNPAFEYLASRLTGACGPVYSCEHSYLICELAQLFDPSYIVSNDITAEFVARLEDIVPFAARTGLVEKLQRDLHLYVAAASGFSIDHSNINDFTAGVLGWWRNHHGEVGVWADAPQIILPCHRAQRQQSVFFLCSRPSSGATRTVPSQTTYGGQ